MAKATKAVARTRATRKTSNTLTLNLPITPRLLKVMEARAVRDAAYSALNEATAPLWREWHKLSTKEQDRREFPHTPATRALQAKYSAADKRLQALCKPLRVADRDAAKPLPLGARPGGDAGRLVRSQQPRVRCGSPDRPRDGRHQPQQAMDHFRRARSVCGLHVGLPVLERPMPVNVSSASSWPCRAAYAASAVFLAASGCINTVYGWSKGETLAGSLTWAGVSAAVAVAYARRTATRTPSDATPGPSASTCPPIG
jgi:hypothetical protein